MSLLSGLTSLLPGFGSLREPKRRLSPMEEAESQHLGKESKVDVLHHAIMAEDLRALAAQDREVVRAKLKQSGLPLQEEADMGGPLIICDDYQPSQQSGIPGWLVALLIATAGGGSGGLGYYLANKEKNGKPPVIEPTHTREGFLIELEQSK